MAVISNYMEMIEPASHASIHRKFLRDQLMKVDETKLYQDDTGIEGMIMISRKYPGQKIPCLRYYVQDIAMSVSIEDNPKAMLPNSIDGSVSTKYEGIVSWIILNRPILLEYWNNAEYPTNCLLNSLKKLNELSGDEIEEHKPYDSTSYSMRRIGLPYVVWVYTYKTESSPIVKITEPSTNSHIIVSLEGDPEIIEGKGMESFDDDIDNIENWIIQNLDNLLAYWTHEIDSVELSERLVYAGHIQYK